jgi:hypothetical protein
MLSPLLLLVMMMLGLLPFKSWTRCVKHHHQSGLRRGLIWIVKEFH